MRALFSLYVPKHADQFLTNEELRTLFQFAGFEPSGMPQKPEAASSGEHEETLRDFFQKRSANVMSHIPRRLPHEKIRIKNAENYVIYASSDADTGTDFMVVREAIGTILFRLHNVRIEKLQQSCERILVAVGAARPWKAKVQMKLVDDIEIYEHDLETPTIKGTLVKGRFNYAWNQSSKDRLIGIGSLLLFFIALVVRTLQFPSGSSPQIEGHFDRFATAMLTASVLSFYSILHIALLTTPPVHWSLHYEKT